MKINKIFKVVAFIFIVVVFISCDTLNIDETGTLVIILPGSNSRAAGEPVSEAFVKTLSYRIECTGPSGIETRTFSPDSIQPISLVVGNWTVKVTVINTAEEEIGSNSKTVDIEGGKTTNLSMEIIVDTSRCSITKFTITSPEIFDGVINEENIIVYVPAGTVVTNMSYTLTHTGVSIEPSVTGTLDLNEYNEATFIVTAENGNTKEYLVRIIVLSIGSGSFEFYESWNELPWNEFGLPPGFAQPTSTVVLRSGLGEEDRSYVSIMEQVNIPGGIQFALIVLTSNNIDSLMTELASAIPDDFMPDGEDGFDKYEDGMWYYSLGITENADEGYVILELVKVNISEVSLLDFYAFLANVVGETLKSDYTWDDYSSDLNDFGLNGFNPQGLIQLGDDPLVEVDNGVLYSNFIGSAATHNDILAYFTDVNNSWTVDTAYTEDTYTVPIVGITITDGSGSWEKNGRIAYYSYTISMGVHSFTLSVY